MIFFIIILLQSIIFSCILYQLINTVIYHRLILKRLINGEKDIKIDKNLEAKMMTKIPARNIGKLTILEKRLSDASINLEKNKFLRIVAILCITITAIMFYVTKSVLFSVITLLTVPIVINIILIYMNKKRIILFSSQLSDIAIYLSSSLKSGYSLMQALNNVSEEGSPPASLEFKRVIHDINLGKTYEEAFDKMVERNPTEDVELLSTGIIISKETGGNLSHILNTVSNTVRERERINGEVKSLTAQGRLSGVILTLLPFVVFILITVTNPVYVKPLFTHSLGKMLIAGGILSQLIGAFFINKIIKIDW